MHEPTIPKEAPHNLDTNTIQSILYQSIDDTLRSQLYDETKVSHWIDTVCEDCMKELMGLQIPYKFAVTCVMLQDNGAGFHSSYNCFWDLEQDDVVQIQWPKKEEEDDTKRKCRMICIVTVGCMAM